MVILVTGGTGFIGSHTVGALRAAGHECVIGSRRGVDVTDRDGLLAAGLHGRIDGIIHLADPSLAHFAEPAVAATVVIDDLRAGTAALFNVLEAAVAWDVRRVVVASTIGVYDGMADMLGVREDEPLSMTAAGNPIGASKRGTELLVAALEARGLGGRVAIARLTGIWGPRGRPSSRFMAAPGLVHAAVAGEPASYPDDAIDLLYVKDCAQALAQLATAARLNHLTYNVAAGFATHNEEIAAAIRRVVTRAQLHLDPDAGGSGADGAYLDTARLREDTGFEPAYDLDAAVAEYVAWLRAGNER